MIRRSALVAAAVFATALAASACGRGGEGRPQGDAGAVNLYTSRHYDADLELYDAFTKKTGIRVNRLEMKADQLIERVKAEGSASPADVILMADAGALWRADQAGLFQPVSSDVLEERIPQTLQDPQNRWFGFSRRARVIAFAKDRVEPAQVQDYSALADPRFRGRVCVRSSENVYNLSFMAALIEHSGRDAALRWARGVVANMARPPQGGDIDQIKAVAAGVCDLAFTNTYYWLRLQASDDAGERRAAQATTLSFPSLAGAGTHVNISGGGIAANAPNREQALKFLEFLASDEAQAVFAGANHEFPAAKGVATPADAAALGDFAIDPIPVVVYGRRQAEAQAVFDEAGWR